jgi:hypothetical protein
MDGRMSENVQGKQEGVVSRATATIVFWWLTAMGMATLALTALIPMWTEYKQVIQVRDQIQRQVATMHKRVDRNNYLIKAYTEDPEALDMLAIADMRYRRPDETIMPLPSIVFQQARPVGWDSSPADKPGRAASKAVKTAPPTKPVERYVERAKALSREYLGTAKSIALVDMFSDPTCRKALTFGSLAVLAAALFLCKSSPSRKAD